MAIRLPLLQTKMPAAQIHVTVTDMVTVTVTGKGLGEQVQTQVCTDDRRGHKQISATTAGEPNIIDLWILRAMSPGLSSGVTCCATLRWRNKCQQIHRYRYKDKDMDRDRYRYRGTRTRTGYRTAGGVDIERDYTSRCWKSRGPDMINSVSLRCFP
jgi:hypothetical protein